MNVGDKYEVLRNDTGLIELKLLPIVEPTPTPEPQPEPEPTPVADIIITGAQGYERFSKTGLNPGTIIDASQATFLFDNNPSTPDEQTVCVLLENCPGVNFKGGVINGFVNLSGEHGATYVDGSGLRFLECPAFILENIRGDKLWDGFRFRKNCNDFIIRNVHFSNCRDDILENDYQHGGLVENCLLEDGLCVMALDPPSSAPNDTTGAQNKIIFKDVVGKLALYNQSGEITHGAVFKCNTDHPESEDTNPATEHYDCVYAIMDPKHNGQSRHKRWAMKAKGFGDCFFLNLSDTVLRSDYPLPPGFTLLQGSTAREKFDAVRTDWLNKNPGLK